VNEFYNNFWGQKPLLVTYHHHHHHSKKLNENSTASHFPQADDDDGNDDDDHDDDAAAANDDRDQIKSNSNGQNKKKKILNKEQSKTTRGGCGGGGGTVISKLTQQQHTTRLDGFLTRSIINDMMSKNKLRYGLDLNVTRYNDTGVGGKDGQFGRQRITLDPLPKKRQKKKKKKSSLSSSSSNSNNGDEDDNVNNNHDDESDDVEYIIANPTDVWTNVDTASCTLRLLRPHEHNDNIHTLLSLLEVEFGCMVGSNAYLTPLHSQGFAPHYDDVDVFICQLEGYKRWRVYSPMSKRETLPRVSSRDYTEKEMNNDDMELVLDVILGPGDVLYMPRGWIHQAETVSLPTSSLKPQLSDKHSLHLTISAMQNWCWADYLEILMPVALESAIVSDKSTSLREGLPRNFLHYMGTMHQMDDDEDDTTLLPEGLRQAAKAQQDRALVAQSHQDDGDDGDDDDEQTDYDKKVEEARLIAHKRQRQLQQQRQFKEEAKKRIMRVCKQAMSMLDDACDEIGKRFLSDRLPPALLRTEACLTKEGGGSNEDSSSSLHHHHHHHDITKKIWPNTLCRIVRPDIARLVVEDSKAVLYHCLDNSRVYHGTPHSPMEFEIDDAPALEQLLTTVEPHWIMVKDLIHGDVEDKIEIAQTLYDEGILATMLVELPDRSVKTG
jgi:lysine-specific demethylase/histidyl-hydroxylase NO66